jgi:hypothetical protein
MSNINHMDIDAIIDNIEFSLHCDRAGTWVILDMDNEVCFSSSNIEEATHEFKTNYLTPEQIEAIQITEEVWKEIAAENRANRALSCDHYAGF